MTNLPFSNDILQRPQVRLYGKVDDSMFEAFLQQFDAALAAAREKPGPILVELTTTGGDAETGRRIATDIRLARERFGADVYFLGKSVVYSAGVSIMSAFPKDRRWLTQGCMLLIHERRLDKTLQLKGAMRGMRALVRDALAEIESAMELECAAFRHLVAGSRMDIDALMARILEADWYVTDAEAVEVGLVEGLL